MRPENKCFVITLKSLHQFFRVSLYPGTFMQHCNTDSRGFSFQKREYNLDRLKRVCSLNTCFGCQIQKARKKRKLSSFCWFFFFFLFSQQFFNSYSFRFKIYKFKKYGASLFETAKDRKFTTCVQKIVNDKKEKRIYIRKN